MTNYQPVSCAMHSELELAIMHGKQLKMYFKQLNKTLTLNIIPGDIVTRKDKGEFLLACNESGDPIEIRLDAIINFSIL